MTLCLTVGLSISLALHAASAPGVPAEGHTLPDQFSQAFQQAATQVDPSVVAILSEQETPTAEWLSGPGDDRGGPFDEDTLRRFFQMPGIPQPRSRKTHGLGSGVIVSQDGTILTNEHVVRNASKLTVEVNGQQHPARVLGTDPATDLAVIKIDAQDLPAASLGNSDDLRVGEWVIAVGNPLELRHSVTAGIVSATGRSSVGVAAYENFIQTDASINPGNSGGALADLDGRVVGINTAIASPNGGSIGIGFAIPINMARKVMDELVDHGRIARGYLGLLPQDLDEDLAGALGIEGTHGALVGDVTADGPAEGAGVRRGDVVVSVDDQPIADATQLRNVIAGSRHGAQVRLGVVRDGARQVLRVGLEERPDVAEARTVTPGREEAPTHKLGLSVQPLTEDLARRLGYENAHGVLVAGTEPGGPAEEAGIAGGDLIMTVGKTEIRSVDELRRALAELRHESNVAVLVRRGERTHYVAVHMA